MTAASAQALRRAVLVGAGLLACVGAASAQAPVSGNRPPQGGGSLEQRVQRIEQVLGTQALLSLLQEVQGLRREVQSLRGENEVLDHKLEQMNQRMRELYVDLDQRLQRGGTGGAEGASSVGGATGTASGGDALQSQQAYQAAVDQLMAGDYGTAVESFEAFLVDHGDSQYAGNATYWLAETYYQQGRSSEALDTYRRLGTEHPDNPKVADASLKSAFILDEQGQRAAAVEALQQVLRDYPGSSVEPLARQRLSDIQQR